jgi:glycosyltransferase involved in cell wall biosynthesis
MVHIFIPTLRPHKIDKIVDNLKSSTKVDIDIIFIVERHIDKPGVLLNESSKSYAGAINTAYKKTNGEYFFCGADDLFFHPNWLETALGKMTKDISVVGTNDLYNPNVLEGRTATHFLVRRKYIEDNTGTMDKSFPVLYEYKHNFCDTEFIDTAKKRGVFTPCLESVVEHLHWGNGKSQRDEVYTKGDATSGEDRKTFHERLNLWL